MKTILNLTAFLGLLVAIWSCGENDGTVFTSGETFMIGLAGLAVFGIGAFLAKVREDVKGAKRR